MTSGHFIRFTFLVQWNKWGHGTNNILEHMSMTNVATWDIFSMKVIITNQMISLILLSLQLHHMFVIIAITTDANCLLYDRKYFFEHAKVSKLRCAPPHYQQLTINLTIQRDTCLGYSGSLAQRCSNLFRIIQALPLVNIRTWWKVTGVPLMVKGRSVYSPPCHRCDVSLRQMEYRLGCTSFFCGKYEVDILLVPGL